MPSSPTIRLREARKEDIPSLVPMLLKAFRGRAMNEAFFPERLRVNEGDVDQLAFRTYGIEQRFAVRDEAQGGGDPPETQHKRYHYLVAVEDGGSGPGDDDDGAAETIVGYAEWVDMTPTEKTEEELAKDKERQAQLAAERKARRPPSLDIEAVDAAYESIAVLEGFLKKALGEEGFANSWCKSSIHPSAQASPSSINLLLSAALRVMLVTVSRSLQQLRREAEW